MDSTLLKGLRVLEAVAQASGPVGATELAKTLDMTKSNAHRVLKTLEAAGYLRRNNLTGKYGLSVRLWELGQRAIAGVSVKVEAQDSMAWLAAETHETVHLSVLDADEVIYLDKIESSEPVRAYTTVGGRAPAYAVATGKALLAWQGPELIEAVATSLKRHTATTLADPILLGLELARIREQGFAVNLGEWRESVGGIAAPIRSADGRVDAAIGISGPRQRITPERIATFATLVIRAAAEISLRLGYRERI
ncbi:IclR family transcriptional regulator [Neotabrizicola sp. sgz301269]|uniref:IclR family transcriptional regulator n=1 Tax=Neotabrizicola sp. sgz301269 TaxID=3276282 RepID=UPI003770711D